MAKVSTKMIYDKDEDILFLSKGRKIKASIDIGDFVIDVDMNGFIAGIEILNASENLNMSSKMLKELQEASMSVTYKPNYVRVTLLMRFKKEKKDVTIPLKVDLGHGSVKTESIQFAVA